MATAVANRPIENFETEVPIPDWQLTPEEEMLGDTGAPVEGFEPMVDENGMPIYPSGQAPPGGLPGMRPDGTGDPGQQEFDRALPPQQGANRYPPRQPRPLQPEPPDPSQPRP
jgi:penicillin-binding protein 1A